MKDDNSDDGRDHGVPGAIDVLAWGEDPALAGYADEYTLNDIGLALRLRSEMP